MEKILTRKFCVEPFHADCFGRLSLPVLGNHLLNMAQHHATLYGFGCEDAHAEGLLWVVARLALSLNKMPCVKETFVVQTWLERTYRSFVERNFLILSLEGAELACGKTVWSVLEGATRRPAVFTPAFMQTLQRVLVSQSVKVSLPARSRTSGQFMAMGDFTPAYSDLDINRHVNSMRYVEKLLDTLPPAALDSPGLKHFEIAYSNEAYAGEKLMLSGMQEQPQVEVRRVCREAQLIASARFSFS